MRGEGYQIRDEQGIHFLTFTVVDWVDVFTRKSHRDQLIDCLNFCIREKGVRCYGFVVMSNHMHLIVQRPAGDLTGFVRDFKKWTSTRLIEAIGNEPESRREWMLHRFEWNALGKANYVRYQLWTNHSRPMEIYSKVFFRQKLDYIHDNPVRAGLVETAADYLYSSAGHFAGRPCLVPIAEWDD